MNTRDMLLRIIDHENPKPSQIKIAGNMVGIDFENPIDVSQMDVCGVYSEPDNEGSFYFVRRKCSLRSFVFNDEGDREELHIHFELKSQRKPKPL